MNETTNLKLKKPTQIDNVIIEDLNDNADLIDAAITDVQSVVTQSIDVLDNHADDYVKHPGYAHTTGTNTYSVKLSPAPAKLIDGMGVVFRVGSSATGKCRLNVNGLGAKDILNSDGDEVDDLKSGGVYTVRYNGSTFILQGEGGGSLDVIGEFERVSAMSKMSDKYVYWINTEEERIIRDGHDTSPNGISVYDLNGTLVHTQLKLSSFDMHASPTEIVQFRGYYNFDVKILRIFDLKGTVLHDITWSLSNSSNYYLFGYDSPRKRLAVYRVDKDGLGYDVFQALIINYNGTILKGNRRYMMGDKNVQGYPSLLTGDRGMYRTFFNKSLDVITLLLDHGGVGYENLGDLNFKRTRTVIPNII